MGHWLNPVFRSIAPQNNRPKNLPVHGLNVIAFAPIQTSSNGGFATRRTGLANFRGGGTLSRQGEVYILPFRALANMKRILKSCEGCAVGAVLILAPILGLGSLSGQAAQSHQQSQDFRI